MKGERSPVTKTVKASKNSIQKTGLTGVKTPSRRTNRLIHETHGDTSHLNLVLLMDLLLL